MNYCIIPLTTVTSAIRLEKEALSKGVICSVVNTPKGLSDRGCSHSVRVRETDVSKIADIGKDLKLTMGGVFREVRYGRHINYIRLEQYDDLF